MKAALYTRVSTEEQANKYGLASQLSELRVHATKRGYAIPEGGEFVDDGYSGADLERPALDRLRQAARARAFDVILVHDPDRLSRRLAHQLLLAEEFERATIRLEFLTTPREDTPEGRLLLHVKAVIAEYEREKIRERTSRGKKEKARRALIPAGPVAYGYRLDPQQPGKLVIHDEEALVVRMVFRWLAEEQRPIREITAELRALGVRAPRGRLWAKSSVRRLLTSELYAGRGYYNRRERLAKRLRFRPESEWIPIPVPPIVSSELFDRARAQLARNKALMVGRPGHRVYLLAGLLRCGTCGRRYVGIPSHGRRLYRCAGRDRLVAGVNRCGARTCSAERLETTVWQAIVSVLRNPSLLAEKIESRQIRLGIRTIEVRSEAEYLTSQIAEADRQEGKLLDLYLDGGLDSPVLRARIQEVRDRRQSLEARLAVVQRQISSQEAEAARQETIRRLCRQVLAGLSKLTPEGRQQLLRQLVNEIVLREQAVEIHGVLPASLPGPGQSGSQARESPAAADRNRLEYPDDRPARRWENAARPPASHDLASARAGGSD